MSASVDPTPRAGSGEMFDAIAGRYDLLNRLISLGLDQAWRERTVGALVLRGDRGDVVVDLATGTGDLALLIARRHPGVRVLGIDPSRGMLDVAREKVRGHRIELQVGDAQALRLPDASVDGVSIAFGIRNVPDRLLALREMARVTRPSGRVAILELTEPRGRVLGALARAYIHAIVPRVGAALSGAREYGYLQRSIAAFPPAADFARLMEEAGLEVLEVVPLTFGVAHLFVGTPRGVAAPAAGGAT